MLLVLKKKLPNVMDVSTTYWVYTIQTQSKWPPPRVRSSLRQPATTHNLQGGRSKVGHSKGLQQYQHKKPHSEVALGGAIQPIKQKE